MKIKTLGHIFLANKLRSAILKTTPGRRAGGVRGGDEDCRYSNWSGYFCILVRFTQSCTSKKIRTKHAEPFFSTISNLGGTIKSILRCKSWKRRNPRPPGRGVRGGWGDGDSDQRGPQRDSRLCSGAARAAQKRGQSSGCDMSGSN